MTGLSGKLETVLNHWRRHGPVSGIRLIAGEALEKTGLLDVGICYALEDAASALKRMRFPEGFTCRELGEGEIRDRASRREDWFFPKAMETCLARGDRCFGTFLDGRLASSCWIALRPLRMLGAIVEFPDDCAWEHLIYTKPEFRGRGLAATMKVRVAQELAMSGRLTLLNTVRWTNDASRRLHERIGYRSFATLVHVGPASVGRTWLIGGHDMRLRISRVDL